MKHLFKILLVLFSLFSISFSFQEISSDSLSQWLQGNTSTDFILIDIRETNELNTIIGSENCGAYNFPYRSGVFDEVVERLPRDTLIVIYCASGNRSGQAASELESDGFSNILSLRGGMYSWNGPTLPGNQIKAPELFPEVICKPPVKTLPMNSFKAPSQKLSPSNKIREINLQGKVCSSVAPGMIIKTDSRFIILKSQKK